MDEVSADDHMATNDKDPVLLTNPTGKHCQVPPKTPIVLPLNSTFYPKKDDRRVRADQETQGDDVRAEDEIGADVEVAKEQQAVGGHEDRVEGRDHTLCNSGVPEPAPEIATRTIKTRKYYKVGELEMKAEDRRCAQKTDRELSPSAAELKAQMDKMQANYAAAVAAEEAERQRKAEEEAKKAAEEAVKKAEEEARKAEEEAEAVREEVRQRQRVLAIEAEQDTGAASSLARGNGDAARGPCARCIKDNKMAEGQRCLM
ncbi:hypothetical protein BV22DRAFT_1052085 [Leucogyrophana mollusca]|uniref:Uncharacterized protein n=1 Tax=Leucogyrophana mollusca TaxID=85980 RepID=A0ACB8AZC3_9AGAM|nr:hypothetical protein BV22DRAFT_1052085 [Leucogyrophana mollusca]